jgi:outer membrane phospholipase A
MPLFSHAPRRRRYPAVPAWLPLSLAASLSLCFSPPSYATVTLLQPPRELAGEQPLTLTLLLAQDAPGSQRYEIPASIDVQLVTTDGITPRRLTLQRATAQPASVTLKSGQYRKVVYSIAWPKDLRGTLRVVPVGFDAAESLVVLNWGADAAAHATTAAAPLVPITTPNAAPNAAAGGTASAGTQIATNGTPGSDANGTNAGQGTNETGVAAAGTTPGSNVAVGTGTASGAIVAAQPAPSSPADASAGLASAPAPLPVETTRLSFYEPVYFAVGASGDTTAKFQLSFKYRIFQPKDPRSRSLFDNLYFGYTQLSLWDLSEESKPFKDTNFRPSLFYYLPDTGVRASWFSQLGIQAGIEHESNGKDGTDSRSINTVFVRPTLTWNNVLGNRLVFSPKIYYYLEKSDNPDIAQYRGYADLLVQYGDPDALELAATFRKGTSGGRGSVDAQLTYPMGKIFGAGFGGYLFLDVFSGYGETLIDYNNHVNAVRIGYSISR